jgi:predicted HicB family RNase H-like nuclease
MSLTDFLPEPSDKDTRKQIGVRLTPEEQQMLTELTQEFQITINTLVASAIRKIHDETFE